jgi:hypothetical protein
MGFVAVKATHLPLSDRVMCKQAELCPYVWMAAITEFSHIILADLLLRVFMKFVTGKTAQIIQGMNAGMPVHKCWSGCCGVALEADQRLCLWGEMFEIKQFGCIALVACFAQDASGFLYVSYSQAARSMTRFTVYQRQPGFSRDLLAMYTMPEEVGNLVMPMALGHAVICTDVLSIQTTDNHLLVFGDRQQLS